MNRPLPLVHRPSLLRSSSFGGHASIVRRSQNGFTLGEFVSIMAVILLLCLAAIPPFFALQNANREKKMGRIIAMVRSGIASWHNQRLRNNIDAYPPALDANPPHAPCKACFGAVLDKPLENNLWFKNSDTEYYFSRFKVVYDPAIGSFTASRVE